MQLISIKTIIAMFWVSAVSLAGLAGHVNSLSSWTLLTCIAVLPLLVIRGWNRRLQRLILAIAGAARSCTGR
jgi:hypothetical protein